MLNLGNIIANSAKYALEQPAPFLRYTTAAAFGISTVAQSVGLILNKDIPKEEKKFLTIQEAVNGVLELTTFMTVATGLENLGKKLATSGKIVSKTMAKNSPGFIKGVTMFASILGTVIAFNLLTPLIRNPVAALIQKVMNKKGSKENQHLTQPILPAANLTQPISFNKANPFASFERKTKLQSPVTFRASGMRI